MVRFIQRQFKQLSQSTSLEQTARVLVLFILSVSLRMHGISIYYKRLYRNRMIHFQTMPRGSWITDFFFLKNLHFTYYVGKNVFLKCVPVFFSCIVSLQPIISDWRHNPIHLYSEVGPTEFRAYSQVNRYTQKCKLTIQRYACFLKIIGFSWVFTCSVHRIAGASANTVAKLVSMQSS